MHSSTSNSTNGSVAISSHNSNHPSTANATPVHQLDEALYSRQLYVMGHEAQLRLSSASILLIGLNGLGVEVAKNLILAGVHSLTVYEPKPAQIADLGSQFYLTEEDVKSGKLRIEASLPFLRSLNPYVNVNVFSDVQSSASDMVTDNSSTEESKFTKILSEHNYSVLVVADASFAARSFLSDYCHKHQISFISSAILGAFVSTFVDCGEVHSIADPNGEQPLRGLLAHISNDNPAVVTCHEESRHGLSDDDYVAFEDIEGMSELDASKSYRIKVISPYSFALVNTDTTKFGTFTSTHAYFQQVKMSVQMKFSSMNDQLYTPTFLHEYGNERFLHLLYIAIGMFNDKHSRLPNPVKLSEAQEVVNNAKLIAGKFNPPLELDDAVQTLFLRLARVASAELSPFAAYAGGIVAQEVLKAASGKFTPIQQWYYYDGSHVLPTESVDDSNIMKYAPQNSRYDHQIAMFGKDFQETLHKLSYFVIGAGAIGCEMLKNFAMIGLACAPNSAIHITDMDSIEKSNLNRQFLFRSSDVGQLKSVTAAREAHKMNPSIHIEAQSLRVSPQSEDVYNDRFFDSIDGIVTALDNVETRLYVDQRAIYYQKPIIDSGTLGTKGSVQVVVPFLTESYGSSRDPPEEGIPICTLRNFPNKIEHTIQWARDAFEGYFSVGPNEVNAYLTQSDYLNDLAKKPNDQLQNLSILHAYLVEFYPKSFDDCISWARQQFDLEYNHKIQQLLYVFPVDAKTQEGVPFWSGPKRAPIPLEFSSSDPLHSEFVRHAAYLRAVTFGIQPNDDVEYINRIAQCIPMKPWSVDKKARIATTEEEAKTMDTNAHNLDESEQKVQELTSKLPKPATFIEKDTVKKVFPIEFEKDDDSNHHIAFITSCSNLRARNYSIKELTPHQTKFIAGKIIPAIATTTALVTGLVCLELYKLAQGRQEITAFHNSSINLALPFFTYSEPLAPIKTCCNLPTGDWWFSLWDRIECDNGKELTLQELLDWFKTKYNLEVNMLSHGAAMLYYNFGMNKKKLKERLGLPITGLITNVTGKQFKDSEQYLVLEASLSNENGDDVEVPYIRYRFRWN